MGEDHAGAPIDRLIAPDGSLLVELEWVEWFNTHWVRAPRVTESASGRVLLDLWGTDWDADVSFPRKQAVRFGLRRYRVRGWLEAEIDLGERCYVIQEKPGEASRGPIEQMAAALDAAYDRVAAAMPQRAAIPPPRTTARSYVVAVLILIGTLLAIATATVIVEHFRPRPVQHLDRIPPMPPNIQQQPEALRPFRAAPPPR